MLCTLVWCMSRVGKSELAQDFIAILRVASNLIL